MNLAERLKQAREELGIDQKTAAAHIGLDQGKICLIEKGARKIDPETELLPLANLYKKPVGWFFGESINLKYSDCDITYKLNELELKVLLWLYDDVSLLQTAIDHLSSCQVNNIRQFMTHKDYLEIDRHFQQILELIKKQHSEIIFEAQDIRYTETLMLNLEAKTWEPHNYDLIEKELIELEELDNMEEIP